MKKTTYFILFLLFFSMSLSMAAQVPSDENFDDNTTFDITSNNFSLDGVRYQISGDGVTYQHMTSNNTFHLSEGGANDYALQFDINAHGGISSITISASNGSAFQIAGMSMDILSDTPVQFTSDNGGSFSLSPNDGPYVLYQNYDFTTKSGFDNITTLTISGTNMMVDIDDLNFEPAVSLATVPTLTTAVATSITVSGTTLNGDVTSDGGATVSTRGFVYSSTDNTPTLGEVGVTSVADGSGTGVFSEAISGLNASTTYYYQAYATNSAGTAYGGVKNFTTLPKQLQNFSWSADNLNAGATGVTYTFEYTIVTNLGGSDAILYALNTVKGWNTNSVTVGDITVLVNGNSRTVAGIYSAGGSGALITLNNPIVANGSEVVVTIANVSNNVNSGTYNWNWIRTATSGGNEIDRAVSPAPIVLSANIPTISTSAATSITTNGATLTGNVTSNGGATVSARGFVFSITDNSPSIGETGVTQVTDGSGTGTFSEAISELSASTTYYYQAYATNSAGTAYGGVESFTTPNAAPIVDANNGLTVTEGATRTIDSGKLHFNDDETEDDAQLTATITSAVTNGTLFLDANLNNTFDAGDEELIVGAAFTQDDINNDRLRYTNTNVNATADSFVFKVSDPDGGELTNQTFTITITLFEVPTVTTTAASNITTTTATLGGNVTANGGLTVTERGIVYNTTGTPTTADTKVQIGSGDGTFSDNITGLTEGTTYYVRAYAINNEGTGYGSEESFITSALGLEDHLKNAVSLYPIPVNNNVLYIKTDTIKDVKVLLFDVMGKRIEGIKIENDAVNLSNIQTGVYVLKIETELGNLVKRIVKN